MQADLSVLRCLRNRSPRLERCHRTAAQRVTGTVELSQTHKLLIVTDAAGERDSDGSSSRSGMEPAHFHTAECHTAHSTKQAAHVCTHTRGPIQVNTEVTDAPHVIHC
jgi:hypothetical protein